MKKRILSALLAASLLVCPGCAMGEVKQTNESLTVAYYGTGYNVPSDVLNQAIARYMVAYPEVELIVEREPYASTSEGMDAYFTKLSAEIMAGKGPDLFWIWPGRMNVYKMMDAGAFADLAPFLEADPDFSEDAYNAAVLNGCRYEEHLYAIPLNYTVPGLMVQEERLEQLGVDYAACADCVSQWDALARYAERYLEDPSLPRPLRFVTMTDAFIEFTGIPWMDTENREVDLSDPRWQTLFADYKQVYGTMSDAERAGDSPGGSVEDLLSGECLFEAYQNGSSYSRAIENARRMSSEGTPRYYPFYDVDGGIQAQIMQAVGVRRTSPNQQNAYNFIRILLEPELQELTGGFAPHNVPLSNQALEATLRKNQEKLEGRWYLSDGMTEDNTGELSDEFVKSYLEMTRKISGATFPSDIESAFFNSMQTYLEGKTEYEAALKETEERLKLYISE